MGTSGDHDSAGFVVLGSGPAGMAAAHALCGAGHRVTVLDAGDRIEPGRMDVFERLAGLEPERWPGELVELARDSFPVDVRRVPLKPAYGSLFPYAREDPDLAIEAENVETLPSLACGGLSNSWGASILPFRERDIADWPISLEELRPHYEAVLGFVPVAGEHDELAGVLPLYTGAPRALRRTRQMEVVLGHLRRNAVGLSEAGFNFGASRLAVNASVGDGGGCRHCGLCLYGCPYGAIYNARHTLERLVSDGSVDYRSGIYVDRLAEDERSVTIDFHHRRRPTDRGRLTAAGVFVACGAISSTRLMLDSTGWPRRTRRLVDSQYFISPMLTVRRAPVSAAEQGNTLAQLFLELDDPRISSNTIHMQLYGYNDLMLAALARHVALSPRRLERLLQPALGRMVIVQGYLHSAESPGLELGRGGRGDDRVRLVGEHDPTDGGRVRGLLRRLAANGRRLGMVPLPGLAQVGRPGKGNHVGGSLSMRSAPGELETDTLGRLPGWRRVSVVDAAILPSVPATTVTLSVMANAHRIATRVAREEP
ncbi:MAG TPA: GMC oxidoreductase [Solirubrobacteraceae bacterium]|nr:GMC oxidoreductase [Solirubrobacteraceae bacterium]